MVGDRVLPLVESKKDFKSSFLFTSTEWYVACVVALVVGGLVVAAGVAEGLVVAVGVAAVAAAVAVVVVVVVVVVALISSTCCCRLINTFSTSSPWLQQYPARS